MDSQLERKRRAGDIDGPTLKQVPLLTVIRDVAQAMQVAAIPALLVIATETPDITPLVVYVTQNT